MEVDLIATQARAAVDILTAQLRHLEHEQTTLLTSLHLTCSTLSTLPNYTAIAPTLSQIPHYESKLARLKAAMAQQQRDVAELKRRALEAGARRRANLKRIEEGRRGERERDRTVLRARVMDEREAAVSEGEGGAEGGDGAAEGAGRGRGRGREVG
ncbi:uncharacterized protein LAJ45_05386 [Morchella importuna]|uniref:uncharacterized protein n=1 Tax=Morchella importuna TaxID=1174673 RepID=UPI001E8E246C|nr:uncharacterized protein LAJ45_05386 [Morchella importuna]KAH8150690.1 hypothetical protein LAJ45_05386 [Morchella importuna]